MLCFNGKEKPPLFCRHKSVVFFKIQRMKNHFKQHLSFDEIELGLNQVFNFGGGINVQVVFYPQQVKRRNQPD